MKPHDVNEFFIVRPVVCRIGGSDESAPESNGVPSFRVPAGKAAFTLIEISMVLVVIGLIVGGILTGRDLIKAAAMRAQISQLETFNTAINTFRVKYGELPGDMDYATALQFGFATNFSGIARGACAAMGNGDGVLAGEIGNSAFCGNQTAYAGQDGETSQIWNDLTSANGLNVNLLPGAYYGLTQRFWAGPVNMFYPQAAIGRGNYVFAFSGGFGTNTSTSGTSGDGLNYFEISTPTNLTGSNGNLVNGNNLNSNTG